MLCMMKDAQRSVEKPRYGLTRRRFDDAKKNPGKFFVFWTMQVGTPIVATRLIDRWRSSARSSARVATIPVRFVSSL